MKKLCLPLALVLVLFAAPGCYTFSHTVGGGGAGGETVEEAAWFALWGLVPLSEPDSGDMAGEATDYTVTTEFTVIDIIISFFTGWVTIHKQTVTVQK